MPSRLSVLTTIGSLLTLGYAQDSSNISTALPPVTSTVTSTSSDSSTYSQSDVPTGTPLLAKYDEPLRPQVHFSPPVGFMNDPNGMFVDEDGVYHLYYQCTQPHFRISIRHTNSAQTIQLPM
jgi:beta-fructofuranosidase